MKFISVGPYCSTVEILKEHNLKAEAYPFDSIFSSLKMIKHAINDKFNIFLDKKYYDRGTNDTSTRHLFYNEFLDTPILLQHHIKFEYPKDYKISGGSLFVHHNLIENKDDYEKFKRRCDRLLSLIESNEQITFVYYNCYTNDYDDIIDFYDNFLSNKNIYVIGIFENNNEKKILYESANCKIYQNYDRSSIFNEM
jgi:hypothetical protein